jgi:hypothetical protein
MRDRRASGISISSIDLSESISPLRDNILYFSDRALRRIEVTVAKREAARFRTID